MELPAYVFSNDPNYDANSGELDEEDIPIPEKFLEQICEFTAGASEHYYDKLTDDDPDENPTDPAMLAGYVYEGEVPSNLVSATVTPDLASSSGVGEFRVNTDGTVTCYEYPDTSIMRTNCTVLDKNGNKKEFEFGHISELK